jgi:hypothetical protein
MNEIILAQNRSTGKTYRTCLKACLEASMYDKKKVYIITDSPHIVHIMLRKMLSVLDLSKSVTKYTLCNGSKIRVIGKESFNNKSISNQETYICDHHNIIYCDAVSKGRKKNEKYYVKSFAARDTFTFETREELLDWVTQDINLNPYGDGIEDYVCMQGKEITLKYNKQDEVTIMEEKDVTR